MKITKTRLRKIINEEIGKFVYEQAETDDAGGATGDETDVELNPDAKRDTQQTATNIQASNNAQVAALEDFKSKNPNLDHGKIDQAIQTLKTVAANVGTALQSAINEADSDEDISEIIRKLSSGDYRVYSKKKNPKTGERRNLGTYSSKSAAEEREQDIHFFKTQK